MLLARDSRGAVRRRSPRGLAHGPRSRPTPSPTRRLRAAQRGPRPRGPPQSGRLQHGSWAPLTVARQLALKIKYYSYYALLYFFRPQRKCSSLSISFFSYLVVFNIYRDLNLSMTIIANHKWHNSIVPRINIIDYKKELQAMDSNG